MDEQTVGDNGSFVTSLEHWIHAFASTFGLSGLVHRILGPVKEDN